MNLNHQSIRDLLRESEDGLTLAQIAERLGKTKNTLRSSVNRMPDVYIDRYIDTSEDPATGELRGGTAWTPVYMAVEVPPDCPRPNHKPRRKD